MIMSIIEKPKRKKTGGKKKGSRDKRSTGAIMRAEYILSLIEPHMEADIKTLSPAKRIDIWTQLQEYVRPKLARTETSGDLNINMGISKGTQKTIDKIGKILNESKPKVK